MMAECPRQTARRQAAMMGPFSLKEKFPPVPACAVFRVELARAFFREKETSSYPCPCGAIHHLQAAPLSSHSERSGAESRDPAALPQGNSTRSLDFARDDIEIERNNPSLKIFARRPPRPSRNSCEPGANARSIQ